MSVNHVTNSGLPFCLFPPLASHKYSDFATLGPNEGRKTVEAPCRAMDKCLPAKEPLEIIDLYRFSFIAFYWRI